MSSVAVRWLLARYHRSRGRRCLWQVAPSARISFIPQRPRSPATPGSRSPPHPSAPSAQSLRRRPRYSAAMVDAVQIAGAQRTGRAGAAKQSEPAIGTGDAARREGNRLRPGGQILSAGRGQLQSDAPAHLRRALAGARLRRQPLRSRYRASDGVVQLRHLGPQSAHGRIARGAGRRAALSGRSGLSIADIECRGRRHHRSVAARSDRCDRQLIATSTKMRDTLRRQLDAGYANRSDLAAQEAALAQARATLPPLRKALAQQHDLHRWRWPAPIPARRRAEHSGLPTCTCLSIFRSACRRS